MPSELVQLATMPDSAGQDTTCVDGSTESWPDAPMPVLLDLDDVAVRLGVSRRSVQRLVADGSLPTVTLGSARRVHVDDLSDFLDSLRSTRPAGPTALAAMAGATRRVLVEDVAENRVVRP